MSLKDRMSQVVLRKDGEKTDNLHRSNIENQDSEDLKTALSNGNTEKAVEVMAKIVGGSEVLPENG